MTMKEIEVKALEWRESRMGTGSLVAPHPFGENYVVHQTAEGYRSVGRGFHTLDEAKAAAQSDYEARIRSALIEKPAVFASRYDEDLGECVSVEVDPPMLAKLRERVAVERKAEPVALSADEIKLLIPLLKAKISEDQSKHFNGKLWGHEIVNMSAMQRLVARLSASPSPVDSREEAFDQIVAARKAHIDAVAAYNARLEFVRVERERGNWLNVDPEYAAMSEAQRAFYRTVQDLADTAIRQRAEEKR